LNSTVNIINTVTQSQGGVLKAPVVVTPPDAGSASTATGGTGGTSKPDDKVPDEKDKSSGKVDVLASKNEPTKKMYCN
ncbi:MAG: hemagglutinin, partial [Burkholderiaceae bacterium]|nr:hemagglutinin [Burkholderiaceae bacterium]